MVWGLPDKNLWNSLVTCTKLSLLSNMQPYTCSLEDVILKSFVDRPSFLTPSILNPRVAVDEMVSLHTMYLIAGMLVMNGLYITEPAFCHPPLALLLFCWCIWVHSYHLLIPRKLSKC